LLRLLNGGVGPYRQAKAQAGKLLAEVVPPLLALVPHFLAVLQGEIQQRLGSEPVQL